MISYDNIWVVFFFWCRVLSFYRYLREAYISRTRAQFQPTRKLGWGVVAYAGLRARFYAILNWICLRGHSLSNIFVWLRTLLQSCSWPNDRTKDNEGEEGQWGPCDYSLVLTWWEDIRQLPISPKKHRARWARVFSQSADDSNEEEEEELEEEEKEEMIPQVKDAGSAVASWQQGNNI